MLVKALFLFLMFERNYCNTCPDDWLDANELGCLYFSGDHTTWLEASFLCESLNSSMVEILSEEEQSLLSLLGTLEIGITRVNGWWIGLDDIGHEGDWTWEKSGMPATFDHWAPGSPSTEIANKDDCAFMIPHTEQANNFLWVDSLCNQQVHIFTKFI